MTIRYVKNYVWFFLLSTVSALKVRKLLLKFLEN
jgi:hypothetical protein